MWKLEWIILVVVVTVFLAALVYNCVFNRHVLSFTSINLPSPPAPEEETICAGEKSTEKGKNKTSPFQLHHPPYYMTEEELEKHAETRERYKELEKERDKRKKTEEKEKKEEKKNRIKFKLKKKYKLYPEDHIPDTFLKPMENNLNQMRTGQEKLSGKRWMNPTKIFGPGGTR